VSEPLVRAVGISRTFRLGEEAVHALNDVSVEAHAGEFTAVVGRSGSGKTTLLNIIGGLDRPDSGHVFIGDRDVTAMSESDLTALRRTEVGFIFQSFGLLPLLSAYENIELALRIAGAGPRRRSERTREVLDLVGLTRRAKHRPYELSGGEQQRVAVARALANQPPLLVADEPTGELDSHTAADIFGLLQRLAREQNLCIIASTHDLAIREAADRVAMLEDGRIVSAVSQPAPGHAVGVGTAEPVGAALEPAQDAGPAPLASTAPAPPSESEPAPGPEDDISRWARPRPS
jgi:putative ABC transport system ATP-binding protein